VGLVTCSRRISAAQLRIIRNAAAGHRLDAGRAPGMSGAGGHDSTLRSCVRRGWLDRDYQLTEAGKALV